MAQDRLRDRQPLQDHDDLRPGSEDGRSDHQDVPQEQLRGDVEVDGAAPRAVLAGT